MNKPLNNKKQWTTWWSRGQRGLALLSKKCPQHHRVVLKDIPMSSKIKVRFAAFYDTQPIQIENVYIYETNKRHSVTFEKNKIWLLQSKESIYSDEIEITSKSIVIEYDIITDNEYYCASGFEYMDYDPFMEAPKQIYALQSIELYSDVLKGCICFFGDSIVEQGNYTRIIQAYYAKQKYAVINLGISGNRLLKELEYVNITNTKTSLQGIYQDISIDKQCFGIRGLQRYQREVLTCKNIKCIVLAIGINDVYQPGTFCAHQKELPTLTALEEGYLQLFQFTNDIPFIWCSITPFIKNIEVTIEKEEIRKKINQRMLEHVKYYIDFDHVFIKENTTFKEDTMQPDYLHPSVTGGKAMAKEILQCLYTVLDY